MKILRLKHYLKRIYTEYYLSSIELFTLRFVFLKPVAEDDSYVILITQFSLSLHPSKHAHAHTHARMHTHTHTHTHTQREREREHLMCFICSIQEHFWLNFASFRNSLQITSICSQFSLLKLFSSPEALLCVCKTSEIITGYIIRRNMFVLVLSEWALFRFRVSSVHSMKINADWLGKALKSSKRERYISLFYSRLYNAIP